MPEGAGTDADGGGAGAEGDGGVETEVGGAEASGPLARVLRVPENVIVGSSGF